MPVRECSVFGIALRGILAKENSCRDGNQNDKMHKALTYMEELK